MQSNYCVKMIFIYLNLLIYPLSVSEEVYAQKIVPSISTSIEKKPNSSSQAQKKSSPKSEVSLQTSALLVFKRWIQTQQDGDFEKYATFYATDFKGVRRSGKRTKHLTRDKWLKDRKRMFRKVMIITHNKPQIKVDDEGVYIHFIQEWASGTYHDVGPKILKLALRNGQLLIIQEDLLKSRILYSSTELPFVSDQLAVVHDHEIFLEVSEDNWTLGSPNLIEGELAYDPECEQDPGDYETDNERYFYCLSLDPDQRTSSFTAIQAVDLNHIPKHLRQWTHKKLNLYNLQGQICATSTQVKELYIKNVIIAKDSELGKAGDSNLKLAKAVMAYQPLSLVAYIPNQCSTVLFSRASDLPPIPLWRSLPISKLVNQRIKKKLARISEYKELLSYEGEYMSGLDLRIHHFIHPRSREHWIFAFVSAPDGCHSTSYLQVVWTSKDPEKDSRWVQRFQWMEDRMNLIAAIDVTADSYPELILKDGLMVWKDGEYERWQSPFMNHHDQDSHCPGEEGYPF